jgi:hypothetical protein
MDIVPHANQLEATRLRHFGCATLLRFVGQSAGIDEVDGPGSGGWQAGVLLDFSLFFEQLHS